MIDLSPDDALFMNGQFNNAQQPWCNRALLDSAFSSYYYYDTELEQICSIYRGIIKNHAFSDGNKRTAVAVLMTYLTKNGYSIKSEDLCDLTMDVALNNYDVSDVVSKLKAILIKN